MKKKNPVELWRRGSEKSRCCTHSIHNPFNHSFIFHSFDVYFDSAFIIYSHQVWAQLVYKNRWRFPIDLAAIVAFSTVVGGIDIVSNTASSDVKTMIQVVDIGTGSTRQSQRRSSKHLGASSSAKTMNPNEQTV